MTVVWSDYYDPSHHLDLWPGLKDLEPAAAHGDDEQRPICGVVRIVGFHHWAYHSVFNRICVFLFYSYSPPDLLERHVCGSESGSTIQCLIVWPYQTDAV